MLIQTTYQPTNRRCKWTISNPDYFQYNFQLNFFEIEGDTSACRTNIFYIYYRRSVGSSAKSSGPYCAGHRPPPQMIHMYGDVVIYVYGTVKINLYYQLVDNSKCIFIIVFYW